LGVAKNIKGMGHGITLGTMKILREGV